MAKPTTSEIKQVTEWFMNSFWTNYPAKYCGRGKGSRAIACKLMVSINPDTDEQERILGNLKAQVRASAQDPNRSYWKIGETYVRNQLWNDEIESAMEVKEKTNLKKCSIDKCFEDVHGSAFKFCAKHVPSDWDDKLRQAWKETGLDRKSPTLGDDCRAYIKSKGFNI